MRMTDEVREPFLRVLLQPMVYGFRRVSGNALRRRW
jgi:hypothetical protein